MADARIDTITQVLRDHGHNSTSTGLTTDDLAKAIIDALDGSTPTTEGDAKEPAADATDETAAGSGTNPETPVGTGTEGGTAEAAV